MRVLRIGEQVGKMDYLTIQHGTPGRSRAVWSRWIRLEKFIQDFGRKIVGRRNLQKFAIMQPDNAEYGFAQARGALNDRIEHRLSIGRRSADDVKHLARRGLMFESFCQLLRSCLYILEQPHVLDRDHRLVGESGGEFDLPVGEGVHLESRQYDYADRHALPQQRDAEHRVSSPNPPLLGETRIGKIGIGLHIGNMDDFALLRGAPKYGPAAPLHRTVSHVLVVLGRISVARHVRIDIATRAMDCRTVGLAQPCRRLHQGVEHGLQVKGGAADDLEYVSGGSLLLQRLAQLVKQARVLDGDHGLVGKGADKRDLLVGEGTYLQPRQDNDANGSPLAQ